MSPRRRLLLVVAGLVVAALGVAVAVLLLRPGAGSRVAQDRPGTVLLVAGYGGNVRSLRPIEAALRASGRTVQVVPPVGDGTGDLREQARRLQAAAKDAVAAGAPSVDVVGYSAGGVVARIWLTDLDGARLARRVVSLGSPHHGTDAAALAGALAPSACPPACRQLVPGSALLGTLRPLPSGVPWVSIWTQDDDVVSPPGSAVLDGAVNVQLQAVCPRDSSTHGQLPSDPLVLALVGQALGTGLDAAPAADRCTALGGP